MIVLVFGRVQTAPRQHPWGRMRGGILEHGPDGELVKAEGNRLFPVDAWHEITPSGVQFNVETVTPPTAAPNSPMKEDGSDLAKLAERFYGTRSSLTPRVEAASAAQEGVFVAPSGNGFAFSCIAAFKAHRPLILKPDDLWAVICHGFAQHVASHAEALRDKFVAHEGKKMLHVQADHLVMGKTPGPVWEATVFPEFSSQIKQHVGTATHAAVAAPFGTSTATDVAVAQITLMAATKEYFAYSMSTLCGVPWVRLDGALADWQSLRARAEALGGLMVPQFAKWWLCCLLPVLDEFVAAYEGRVDHLFWQHMVKVRHHGMGSGAHTQISGWLSIFFPYLQRLGMDERGKAEAKEPLEGCSPHVKPWRELTAPAAGPRPEELPSMLSSAPVRWDYLGAMHELHFHAGCVAVRSDAATGALSPHACWLITHDPPVTPEAKLLRLRELASDIGKAYPDGSPASSDEKRRLKQLHAEIAELEQRSV